MKLPVHERGGGDSIISTHLSRAQNSPIHSHKKGTPTPGAVACWLELRTHVFAKTPCAHTWTTFKEDLSSGRLTEGRPNWKYDSQSTNEHRFVAMYSCNVAPSTSFVVATRWQYTTVLSVPPPPPSTFGLPQSGVTQSQPICSARIQLTR